MKSKTVGIVFGLAAGAAGVVGQRPARSPLPVNAWLTALSQVHGPEQAQHLLAKAESRRTTLIAARPIPGQPALRARCAAQHPARTGTLPGAARNSRRRPASSARRQCCLLDSCLRGTPDVWPRWAMLRFLQRGRPPSRRPRLGLRTQLHAF